MISADRMSSENIILFITYTMNNPIVGGAFMRAFRLATEMSRRGWRPIICNSGPMLMDPKIAGAAESIQFVRLVRDRPELTVDVAAAEFEAMNPDIIVMGEGPIAPMRLYYDAARRLPQPFIVLDQFYRHGLLPDRDGVDLVLLYALSSFWKNDLYLQAPYEITPPFIEEVARKPDLPLPLDLQGFPWITFVAYDAYVLKKGLDLLARLAHPDLVKIVMSRNPAACLREAKAMGLSMEKFVCLPLQLDPVMFGFFSASAASLVSNGFMQIMDCLALGSPVVALERSASVGMNELNIDSRFFPYVSFGECVERQLERINGWLKSDAFSPEMRMSLATERHGVVHCATRVEAFHRRYLWRQSRRLRWTRSTRGALGFLSSSIRGLVQGARRAILPE
jgi:hypothetical protein